MDISQKVPCSKFGKKSLYFSSIATDKNLAGAIVSTSKDGSEYKQFNLNYLEPDVYMNYATVHQFGGQFMILGINRPIHVKMLGKEGRPSTDDSENKLSLYTTGHKINDNPTKFIQSPFDIGELKGVNYMAEQRWMELKERQYSIDIRIGLNARGGDNVYRYSGDGWHKYFIEQFTNQKANESFQKLIRHIHSKNQNDTRPIQILFYRDDGNFYIDAKLFEQIIQITILMIDSVGAFFGNPTAGEFLRPYANMLIDWAKTNDGKPLNAEVVINAGVSVVAQYLGDNSANYVKKVANIYNAYNSGNYGAIANELGATSYLTNLAKSNPETFKYAMDSYQILAMTKLSGQKYSDISNIITAYNQTTTVNTLTTQHSTLKETLKDQKLTDNKTMQNVLLGLAMNPSTINVPTAKDTQSLNTSDLVHSVLANQQNNLSLKERQQLLNISANVPVDQGALIDKTIEAIITKAVNDNVKTVDLPHALPESTKTCIEEGLQKNGFGVNRTRHFKRNFFSQH